MNIIEAWKLNDIPVHIVEIVLSHYFRTAIPQVADEEVLYPVGGEKSMTGFKSRETNSKKKVIELHGVEESNPDVQKIKTFCTSIRDSTETESTSKILFSDFIVKGAYSSPVFSISNLPPEAPIGSNTIGTKRPFLLRVNHKKVRFPTKEAEDFGSIDSTIQSAVNGAFARSRLVEGESLLAALLADPVYEMKKDRVWISQGSGSRPIPKVAEVSYFFPKIGEAEISSEEIDRSPLEKYFQSRIILDSYLSIPANIDELVKKYSQLPPHLKLRVLNHGRWKSISRSSAVISKSLSFNCLISSLESLLDPPCTNQKFSELIDTYLSEYSEIKSSLYSLRSKISHGSGFFEEEENGGPTFGARKSVLQFNYTHELSKAVTIAFHRWLYVNAK